MSDRPGWQDEDTERARVAMGELFALARSLDNERYCPRCGCRFKPNCECGR